MSEFGFDANFDDKPENVIDDPAAEFLAREKETLAGLEDEFEAIQIPTNTETSQQQAAPAAPTTNSEVLMDDIDSFTVPSAMEEFEPSLSPQVNGLAETSVFAATKPAVVREEPEKIRKWREEQKALLEEKDAEEALKKEELRKQAEKELEDWYTRYKEQIEKSKLNNRNTEKEWVAERDNDAPPGQEWERIAKLCDFNPKCSRNSKDTSRMRSIILQLKQSPPVPTKS